MLKSSIFYIPVAILAYIFVGCIIAAIVAGIYLFCKEVAKAKKPAHVTAVGILSGVAIYGLTTLIF